MSPNERTAREAAPRTACTDCEAPLPPGNTIRCSACVEAAHIAIAESGGKTVRPSDIAAIRARSA